MAITRGVWAIDGVLAGTRAGRSVTASRCRSSTVHELDAGVHTSGRGPSSRAFQPRASASIAPPDAFDVTVTATHLPFRCAPERL